MPLSTRLRELAEECESDEELGTAVSSLLARDDALQVLESASSVIEVLETLETKVLGPIASSAPAESSVPRRISRYTPTRVIAAGAFGTVYLAFDSELKRPVAIKVPRPESSLDANAYLIEAQTVANLRHPGIVPVYDAGRDDEGMPFVVMMYVDGPSLGEWIATGRPSPEGAADLLARVANAVHHAHTKGFVHRDLKPSNVLLDCDGRVYVADFGLALHERVQHRHKGDASGTPHYRSPEQVRGEADWLDGRCDIWALGVILYEVLTGRHPFSGADLDEQILGREPRPLRIIDDRIPEALEKICLRCLAKAPDRRYSTADDLAKDLRRFLAEHTRELNRLKLCEDESGNAVLTGARTVTVVRSANAVSPESAGSARASKIGSNPYKGLAAFHEEDAHLFFGREEQVARLWETFEKLHIETRAAEHAVRVIPLLGPSGCGKSSLARAGLVAELARRSLPAARGTRVAIITPGSHPLESLANVLARILTGEPAPVAKSRELVEEFRRVGDGGSFDGLRRVASFIPDIVSCPLVVLVDQFEEVYSLCEDSEECRAFVENLLGAASDRDQHVSVVITLRSDFLGQTQGHERLNRLIAEQGFIVPSMSEEELRRAIAEPAERSGHALEPLLVDLLLEECRGRDGVLPLLEFALAKIWEGLGDGVEPLETLRSLGGVGGALAREAQAIYESLDSESRAIARRLFLALVQLGEGAKDTRRRVSLDAIAGHKDSPARVRAILERFGAPGVRLITLSSGRD
ncbi:MAG TPA: serine/threonine-protein kinase, partial [Planctomycetota bacterium]|nr:serine/threonine-protein kinase [Planctomycetota bacterium]